MVMILGSMVLTMESVDDAMARLSSREETTFMQVRSRLRGMLRSVILTSGHQMIVLDSGPDPRPLQFLVHVISPHPPLPDNIRSYLQIHW